ncbi:hypothetical protein, partial [Streptomyces sp. NPDC053427]|uniref:hypothetical protein n=1 Tax=Streptomyces sp. NPDC053427 TaxID=3365701 RepID=UPI0037CFF83E
STSVTRGVTDRVTQATGTAGSACIVRSVSDGVAEATGTAGSACIVRSVSDGVAESAAHHIPAQSPGAAPAVGCVRLRLRLYVGSCTVDMALCRLCGCRAYCLRRTGFSGCDAIRACRHTNGRRDTEHLLHGQPQKIEKFQKRGKSRKLHDLHPEYR